MIHEAGGYVDVDQAKRARLVSGGGGVHGSALKATADIPRAACLTIHRQGCSIDIDVLYNDLLILNMLNDV